MRRKRRERGPVLNGREYQPTLWDIGDYGTGRDLMEFCDQAGGVFDALPAGDGCERCGRPTGGLSRCCDCMDEEANAKADSGVPGV